MTLLHLLTWAAAAALVAFVYSDVLTQGGMILNPWYNWLDAKIGPGSPKPRPNLFKPLVGCIHCVAGQFGFWGYLVMIWRHSHDLTLFLKQYDPVHHLVFTSFAIFGIKLLSSLYKWKTQDN